MLTALDLPTLKSSQEEPEPKLYMCDWLPQVFPYRIHHCHHSHYAHHDFNTLSIIIFLKIS